MASINGEQIWAQIEDDFGELMKKAAKEAATKAQKDIRKKADSFIKEYYAYKPKMYTDAERKHLLYELVEDYYKETERSNGLEIEFGVKYNPSKISGKHRSNSWYHQTGTHWIPRDSHDWDWDSQNHGIPDATWITEKFLEGIHPSGRIGDDGGVRDDESPDKKMQDFFDDELQGIVDQYISSSLLNSLRKYF